MQIFISTHSYNSIKYITNKSNKNEYNLYHSKDGSINKCEISEVEDIFFNDIGELPAIKENCDYFIITEDEKSLIEKLIPNEYSEKIQVMPSRKSDILRIYQEIIKISKKCCIIFHVDLDRYEEYESTLKSKNIPINNDNIILWHTDYATMEGYWLIYDNLKSLIKSMKKDEEEANINEHLNKIIIKNIKEINNSIYEYFLKIIPKEDYNKLKPTTEYINSFLQKIENSKNAKNILDYILEESVNISKKGKETGIGKYIKNLLNKIIKEYFSKDIKIEFNNINCPESLLKHIEKWFNKKIKN